MSIVTLLAQSPDRAGLVAAVSDFVFRNDGNIIEADQFTDKETGRFFLRLQWAMVDGKLDRHDITIATGVLAKRYDMDWDLHWADDPQRVAIFCSKTPHCLYDLLLRHRMGEFPGDIALVVSNHEDLREVTQHFGVPFHHLPVTPDTKTTIEATQRDLLREHDVDLVVLARYMQILSPDFVAALPGRIINIHHSFLPAFKGARPYHQARKRGVKIIGATAHYVTDALDEGPIIEQDVVHVTHRDTVADMVRRGRDLERLVLARAVRLHLEHRVLTDGNRTVVFQ